MIGTVCVRNVNVCWMHMRKYGSIFCVGMGQVINGYLYLRYRSSFIVYLLRICQEWLCWNGYIALLGWRNSCSRIVFVCKALCMHGCVLCINFLNLVSCCGTMKMRKKLLLGIVWRTVFPPLDTMATVYFIQFGTAFNLIRTYVDPCSLVVPYTSRLCMRMSG